MADTESFVSLLLQALRVKAGAQLMKHERCLGHMASPEDFWKVKYLVNLRLGLYFGSGIYNDLERTTAAGRLAIRL